MTSVNGVNLHDMVDCVTCSRVNDGNVGVAIDMVQLPEPNCIICDPVNLQCVREEKALK